MLAVIYIGDLVRVAAKSICFSVPRQNGKSFAARLYAIWAACIQGKKSCTLLTMDERVENSSTC